MSDNRPIPAKAGPSRLGGTDFTSSFAASFLSVSPIAQEVIASDLAECSDNDVDDEEAVDQESVDPDEDLGPTMYRRPSGIAFGTTRPAMGPSGQNPFNEPVLSRIEKKESRNAERSLLRDNHLLPPKHPVPQRPSFLGRIYKQLFSTKVPLPVHEEEAIEGPAGPSERSPLLGASGQDGAPVADGHEHLNEQWEAAVAGGHLKTTWQREAKTIAVYSRSLIITFLLQYSINIASIFAVGHIGTLELGAVSLATMSANIICYAPLQGLSTSLDTLCAQAYGSGHKHLVGLQFQRMTCFLLLLFIPIIALFFNAETILAQIIPERRSAELAGTYMKVILFGVPAFICFEGGKRFVQAQGLFQATTYVLLVAAPLNILLNYLFVWRFGWGFIGAPIAVAVTQNLMPVLLFLYVWRIDGKQCWGGWSKRAFTNWWPMVRLALPGMIMIEAEWFAFEILTLFSGRFGTAYLAAQSVLVTITSTTFQIVFPLSIAGSTRVANLIGAKLVDAAKTCSKVTIVAGFFVGMFNVTIVSVFRYQLPALFTQEQEVVDIVAKVLPLCAVMQLFDGLASVSHGLLRGVGKQEFGGYANLISYYVVALPISFGTAFGLDWKLEGLWLGVTVGLIIVGSVEYLYLYKSDWDIAVKEAERRNEIA